MTSSGWRAAVCLLTAALAALITGATPPPDAASAPLTRPNIILIVTDDQTPDSAARMPYVQSQPWVRFPNAHVENSLCCPSRATILTGQWDTHTGVGNNLQAGNLDTRETLPVWLHRAGYRTGIFGKYLNRYDGTHVPPGWDQWHVPFGSRIDAQYDYLLSTNGVTTRRGWTRGDYQVDLLARRASTFITSAVNAGRPFFAYWAPTATHSPWVPSLTRRGAFADAVVPHPANFNEPDVTDKPAYIRARPLLDAATEDANHRRQWESSLSIDDAFRGIDRALANTGARGSTVVIFTSDNGYAFGAHRWDNKRCEYDACSRVPLYVRYPGRPDRVDRHLVTNTDLASTVTHVAGTTPDIPQDGRSLLPLVLGRPVTGWRDAILTHWSGGDGGGRVGTPGVMPQWWGVRTATEKYVELDTGEREFYDLVSDPRELSNRVGNPAYAGRVAALRTKLAWLKARAGAGIFPHNPAMPAPGPVGPDLD